MDLAWAFVAGLTVAGALFTANRAIDVWKASVVPNPKSNPELDAVRVALSQMDPEAALAAVDKLAARVKKLEDGGVAHDKLVALFERMNVLSNDMVDVKAAVVKLQSTANWKSLAGGKIPHRDEAPTDG